LFPDDGGGDTETVAILANDSDRAAGHTDAGSTLVAWSGGLRLAHPPPDRLVGEPDPTSLADPPDPPLVAPAVANEIVVLFQRDESSQGGSECGAAASVRSDP
jgi:hypothetical protein